MYTENRNGLKITIKRDEYPESPDSWGDDNLFLAAYHRGFFVESSIISKEEAQYLVYGDNNNEYMRERAKELTAKYHFFNLEAYIHSGVSLALAGSCEAGNFPDRQWDVSLVGLVAVSREEWPAQADAIKAGKRLVEIWDDYLSGNVYEYTISTPGGNVLECLSGIYGDYETPHGALYEARASVDSMTNNGATDYTGQMLFSFMQ